MEDGQRQNGKLRETEGEWETDRNSTGDGQRKNGKLRETDGQWETDKNLSLIHISEPTRPP